MTVLIKNRQYIALKISRSVDQERDRTARSLRLAMVWLAMVAGPSSSPADAMSCQLDRLVSAGLPGVFTAPIAVQRCFGRRLAGEA